MKFILTGFGIDLQHESSTKSVKWNGL